ncbi:MAG: hypothetical protein KC502_12875 [Myxococcales bacterium]|nr:hypothetical protein [Myxococcales bacterium]
MTVAQPAARPFAAYTNRRASSPALRRSMCPCCGAKPSAWVPIRYGMVAASVYAQARRGEVVIGPVNHGRNEPRWACSACDTRFGRAREEFDRFGRPLEVPSARRRHASKEHRIETLEPASLRTLEAGVQLAA